MRYICHFQAVVCTSQNVHSRPIIPLTLPSLIASFLARKRNKRNPPPNVWPSLPVGRNADREGGYVFGGGFFDGSLTVANGHPWYDLGQLGGNMIATNRNLGRGIGTIQLFGMRHGAVSAQKSAQLQDRKSVV
jgi:hypothetical protein